MPPALSSFLQTLSLASLPFLLETALKGAVLLILAVAIVWLLRGKSAALRHFVWTLTLAALLLLPIVSRALPAWRILPAWPTDPANVNPGTTFAGSIPGHARSADDPRRKALGAGPIGSPVVSSAADARSAIPCIRRGSAPWSRTLWFSCALAVWAAGFLLILSRISLSVLQLRTIEHRCHPVTRGSWQKLFRDLAGELKLNRPVRLLSTSDSVMPMTWGGLWPGHPARVLLPRNSDRWSADQRRAVLVHELAHIKRRDCLTQLIASFICAVYWFNPLVWFALWRMKCEREQACDDLVLASGVIAGSYAEHILELATGFRSKAMPTAIAMARRSSLEGRIVAILDRTRLRLGLTPAAAAGLTAAIMLLSIPLGTIGASSASSTPSPAKPAIAPVTGIQSAATPLAQTPPLSPSPSDTTGTPGTAQRRPAVALVDFKVSGYGPPSTARLLSQSLAVRLDQTDAATVVERKDLQKVLQEQKLALAGMLDDAQAVHAGRLLGADLIVMGRLSRVGDQLFVLCKGVDPTTSQVKGFYTTFPANTSLKHVVNALANRLGKELPVWLHHFQPASQPRGITVEQLQEALRGKVIPKVAVVIFEKHLHAPSVDPAVETEFKRLLLQVGVQPVEVTDATRRQMIAPLRQSLSAQTEANADQANAALLDLSDTIKLLKGVDDLIYGSAFSETAGHLDGLALASSRAEVRIINVHTRRTVLVDCINAGAPGLSAVAAGKRALQRSGRQLAARMLLRWFKLLPERK